VFVKNTKAILKNICCTSLIFLIGVVLSPKIINGYERNTGFGGEIGYCASDRAESGLPELVHGGALGLHLTYGITETWGISLEGNLDWYPPYQTYVLDQVIVETEDGDTDTLVGWVHGPWIGSSFLTSATASIIYMIDIMRVLPYVAVGLNASRSILKSGARYYKGSELGLRVSVGADYMFSPISGAGLALHEDISLVGTSAFSNRLAIMVRFIYFFNVENFVKRRRRS
jgi:hypothetical protein